MISIAPTIVALICLLAVAAAAAAAPSKATAVNHLTVPPVQVLVCVEALCIDSQRFFHDQLMIAFNALGHDVMNLTVVSFGNANLPSSGNRTLLVNMALENAIPMPMNSVPRTCIRIQLNMFPIWHVCSKPCPWDIGILPLNRGWDWSRVPTTIIWILTPSKIVTTTKIWFGNCNNKPRQQHPHGMIMSLGPNSMVNTWMRSPKPCWKKSARYIERQEDIPQGAVVVVELLFYNCFSLPPSQTNFCTFGVLL